MSKAYKGGDFEREICKRLSMWWTNNERDDVYWRSSQSGGRATERTKKGKTTYGSYGDIAAVDPIGEPLLKLFTIELKRGSSYGCPGDLLDFKLANDRHPWAICLSQAIRSHEQAGSHAWMMICRRDHRLPMVYMETRMLQWIRGPGPIPTLSNVMRLNLVVRNAKDEILHTVALAGLPLECFLSNTTPKQIIDLLKEI